MLHRSTKETYERNLRTFVSIFLYIQIDIIPIRACVCVRERARDYMYVYFIACVCEGEREHNCMDICIISQLVLFKESV